MRLQLFVDSDNVIRVSNLRYFDAPKGQYLNDAVLTAEIREADDTTVVASGISMAYVADSAGQYVGIASDDDLTLEEDENYWVRIRVVSTQGKTTLREKCKAEFYTGC